MYDCTAMCSLKYNWNKDLRTHWNGNETLTQDDRGLEAHGLQLEPVPLQVTQAEELVVDGREQGPRLLQEEGASGLGCGGVQYGGCFVQADVHLEVQGGSCGSPQSPFLLPVSLLSTSPIPLSPLLPSSSVPLPPRFPSRYPTLIPLSLLQSPPYDPPPSYIALITNKPLMLTLALSRGSNPSRVMSFMSSSCSIRRFTHATSRL